MWGPVWPVGAGRCILAASQLTRQRLAHTHLVYVSSVGRDYTTRCSISADDQTHLGGNETLFSKPLADFGRSAENGVKSNRCRLLLAYRLLLYPYMA